MRRAERPRRMSLILPPDLAREIEAMVPSGRRNRVIADLLRKELLRRRRERAWKRLCERREGGRTLPRGTIVRTLRKMRSGRI